MRPRRPQKFITSIFLERELHERLKDVAAESDRSTNAEIVHRLKESLRRDDQMTEKCA
jgi:hypothetical protein